MPDIALVNDAGLMVGQKSKKSLQSTDTYHGVFVLLISGRQLMVRPIASGHLSATAMVIRQAGETPEAAATRAAAHVTSNGPALHHLGDQFYTNPDGRKLYMSVFYGAADMPRTDDSPALSAAQLDASGARLTPALRFIWQHYRHLLPL